MRAARDSRFACPVSACAIFAPRCGCPRCGIQLEPFTIVRVGTGTTDTAAWSSGVRLRCAEHGDWQWHESEEFVWTDDRSRRIRITEPGPLAWPLRDEQVADAKRIAGRRGVQVWSDNNTEHDEYTFEGRPLW